MSEPNNSHPSDVRLRDFLNGRLTEREVDAIEAHLGECPACCQKLEMLHKEADAFLAPLRAVMSAQAASDHDDSLERLSSATSQSTLASEGPGTVIGHYKLLQKIGEGGMGTVYMAEQQQPVRRKVALKIVKLGMDTKQVIARFESERQALAMMDHVNIARVFDAGATETGRPYFVMELIKGFPITEYCDRNRLTVRERLELFVPACQAIQHAHQKGIIHRDIKPSNVLVCLYDGRPVPKIIDFGVAKAIDQRLTERTMFTQFGAIIGTLEYMSPEQAEMSQLDVDTRSDIYSLGVLLYELLTGTTPLDRRRLTKTPFEEILRMIRDEDADTPSTRISNLSRVLTSNPEPAGSSNPRGSAAASGPGVDEQGEDTGRADPGAAPERYDSHLARIAAQRRTEPKKLGAILRGDLDWIVMKALEKDRTRRYETANGLARDVQRYLSDEPIEARPPSTWYRVRKLARKNRGLFVVLAAIFVMLVVSSVISLYFAKQARLAASRAEELRQAADVERREAVSARDAAARDRSEAESARGEADIARRLAETERDNAVRVAYYAAMNQAAQHARASPRAYATARVVEQWRLPGMSSDPRGWEWHWLNSPLANEDLMLYGHTVDCRSVSWSPGGRMLASAGLNDAVRIWDGETGHELAAFPARLVVVVSWSPNGRWLAAGNVDGQLFLLDPTREATAEPTTINLPLTSIAWSPDSQRLALGSDQKKLEIRDVESRELLASAAQTEHLRLVRWSQDGSLIATTAENRIRLWDPSLRPVRELAGHTARVIGLHWDRQSNQLWSAASDGSVKTWDAATGQELHAASVPMISAAAADWNPHGTEVAFCDGNQIVLANTKTGESLAVWQTARVPYDGFGELISWSDDGRKLSIAQTSWSAPVPVWSVARMKERHTAQTPMRLSAPPPINGVPLDWSRDGQFLASSRNGLTIWHTMPLRPVQAIDVGDYPPQQFQFSPDARRLAIAEGYEVPNHYGPDPAVTAKAGTGVRVVRVDDGSMVWQKPLSDGVCSVAWSTDGAYLAASTWREPLVHLFDGTTGAELPKISATSMMMSQIDWAPSGHRLATAANYRVEVRDIEVDTVTFSAPAELHNAYRIRFNRDGTRLAYNMSEGLIRVVHVAPNSSPSSLEGHTHNLIGLDWSSDDSRLASVDRSGTVRVWDVTRNQEILSLGEFGFAVAWDPTGPRLAVSNAEGDVAILDASPSYERESPPELVTKLEHRLARTPSDHELAERLDVALARAGQWDRATAVCEDRATKSVASPITQLGWWSLSGQAADSWRQRHHRSDSSPGHEPASSPPISERFATVNASAAVSRSARVDSPPVRESTLTPDRADWPADARWYTPVDGANGWAPIVPEVSVYVSRIHATRDLDAALVLGIHSVESLWLNGREIQPAGADASTKRNRLHTLVRLGAGWNTLTVFVPSDREPDRYASVQARFSSEPADLALAYSRAGRGDQAAAAARASDPSDPRLTRVINP